MRLTLAACVLALTCITGGAVLAAQDEPAANNPLASPEVGEELHRRGVLYAPDFVVNAGGLRSVLFETGALDEAGIVARVERIGADLAVVLERAQREGAPPFRVAEQVVAERLAAARAAAPSATAV